MDQEGFLEAERRLHTRQRKLVRPQHARSEQHTADCNGLQEATDFTDDQVEENGAELEVGADEVQDTGGSAGSGLQSGLGQGTAAEIEGEELQEIEDDEEEEGRKGRGMPSPMTVTRKERERSMS